MNVELDQDELDVERGPVLLATQSQSQCPEDTVEYSKACSVTLARQVPSHAPALGLAPSLVRGRKDLFSPLHSKSNGCMQHDPTPLYNH